MALREEANDVRRLMRLLGEAAREDTDPSALLRVISERDDIRPDTWRRLVSYMLASSERFPGVASAVESILRVAGSAPRLIDDLAGSPDVREDPEEITTADDLLGIARVRGEARAAIFDRAMLSSASVAKAVGLPPSNREAARSLRNRGEAIGLPHRGGYVYPAFQFDPRRHRVWPVVARVNAILDAGHDPWGVAAWWFTVDPGLGGEPSQLVTDRGREADVIASAEAILEPIG